MGNSSSKSARRLGSQVSSAVRAPEAPHVPKAVPNETPVPPQRPFNPESVPKHTKDAAIERDAMDPQLVRNLFSLGQVDTSGPREFVQPRSSMTGILEARSAASQDESGLPASDLVRFFDEYKRSDRTPAALERLAIEYDIGQDTAAALVRWVSTPGQQPLRW